MCFPLFFGNCITIVKELAKIKGKEVWEIQIRFCQTTVDGLKAISRVDFCVIDADGKVAAKTFEDAQNCIADAIAFMDSPAESQVVNGYSFSRY